MLQQTAKRVPCSWEEVSTNHSLLGHVLIYKNVHCSHLLLYDSFHAEFPIVKVDGSLDVGGAQRRAGFQMAIQDINNKADGLYDDILPLVVVKHAIRDGHVSFSDTVIQTLDMTNNAFSPHGVHGVIGGKDNFEAAAIAGLMAGVDLPQISCK